jgi:predicted enzyme related to lactoylglutathione lyase
MWLTWIQVEDVDGTVETAGSHGGQVHVAPFDVPGVGRLSILADNTGGVFGVITPPSA